MCVCLLIISGPESSDLSMYSVLNVNMVLKINLKGMHALISLDLLAPDVAIAIQSEELTHRLQSSGYDDGSEHASVKHFTGPLDSVDARSSEVQLCMPRDY